MRLYENQRGQVLPIVALSLAALMGFGAFAVDLGYLRYQQRLQQYAVDAAAIAAAWQLQTASTVTPSTCGDPSQPGSPPAVCTAGQTAAATNGFTNNGTTKVISVNYPPASGAYSGDTSAVEALVTAQQPAWFSTIFGTTSNLVTTRAVALIRGNPNAACIYTLPKNPGSDPGNLVINAGAQVNAPCGMLIGNDLQASSADQVNVPSIGAEGHINCGPCTSSTVTATGIPPVADPCPTIPGCVAITATFPDTQTPAAGPYASCASLSGSPTSLAGGCYTNNVSLGNVDLAPGLYVFQGDFTANNITCSTCVVSNPQQSSDTGVTLVVGGKIQMNGGTTNLTAPPGGQGVGSVSVTQSGAPGVLIYQTGAGNCTSPQNQYAGTLYGMVYAPSCLLNVNAGSTLTLDFVVVNQMEANGIVLTVPANGHDNPPQTPTLAE